MAVSRSITVNPGAAFQLRITWLWDGAAPQVDKLTAFLRFFAADGQGLLSVDSSKEIILSPGQIDIYLTTAQTALLASASSYILDIERGGKYREILSGPVAFTSGAATGFTMSVSTGWYIADSVTPTSKNPTEPSYITSNSQGAAPSVTGITVSPSSLTLDKFDPPTILTATVTGTASPNQAVSWESTDRSVVTVHNGVVTPNDYGNAKIIVRSRANASVFAEVDVFVASEISVIVSPATLSMYVGAGTQALSATVVGITADRTVTWSSSAAGVASVVGGTVTPVSAGSATITATSNQDNTKSDTCAVTVASITSVSLEPATATLTVGSGTQQLTPTVTGTGHSSAVTYSTSNAAVATVNSSGLVTAGGTEGTAIITVTAADGIHTDTSTITVAAAADTRPRYGVAPANPTASLADIFAALSPVAGSSAGSRVAGNSGAPLSVAPTGTDYGWFACLTSAGAPTFNNSLGTNVWDGALTAGQLFTGIDPGPTTTTHASYTDGSGNVWSLFRQELLLTNESFWVN